MHVPVSHGLVVLFPGKSLWRNVGGVEGVLCCCCGASEVYTAPAPQNRVQPPVHKSFKVFTTRKKTGQLALQNFYSSANLAATYVVNSSNLSDDRLCCSAIVAADRRALTFSAH